MITGPLEARVDVLKRLDCSCVESVTVWSLVLVCGRGPAEGGVGVMLAVNVEDASKWVNFEVEDLWQRKGKVYGKERRNIHREFRDCGMCDGILVVGTMD